MATSSVSSGGMIDVQGIVAQLMSIERQPLTRLDGNIKGINTKISEIGKLQAAMDKLKSAASALNGLDNWKSATASSSLPEAVGITAAQGALPGSYELKVNELAQHQTLVTAPAANRDALVGGGTLTLQFGSGDGAGFAPDAARPPIDIPIPAGATLTQVSAAINAAGAGIGASLVTDSAGTRLMIRSTESGEKQAFSISVTDDGSGSGGLGLASLAYAPGDTGGGVERLQTALNAQVELNGLALSLASNTSNDAIENVSFTFNKKTDTPVSVTVSTDSEAIRGKIDEFVTAYNELNSLIKTQTAYDPTSKSGGPLQGNRTVMTIQSRMREIVGASVDGLSLGRLSGAGIQIQRDGSLLVADDKMKLALQDPKSLQALFANPDASGDSSTGIAARLNTMLSDMLGVDGAVTGATNSLQSRKKIYQDQEDNLNNRLTSIEARLVRQYSALDANLAQLSGSLNAVSNIPTA